MVEHPLSSDFERFVAGASPESADFERHVTDCDACASTLAREARVQLVAEAAARDLRSRRDWMARLRGPGYVMGVALAVAASLFLFLRAPSTATAAEPGPAPINRDDLNGQPVAFSHPDGGMEGPFLAVRDAGPFRPGLPPGI